jgi:hypothetical protein
VAQKVPVVVKKLLRKRPCETLLAKTPDERILLSRASINALPSLGIAMDNRFVLLL